MLNSKVHHASSHGPARMPSAASSASSTHDQLVKQTQKWVSQTFYGTLLKHMHDSPFKSKMMDGGRGGEAFSGLYDQQLADRMSHGVGSKLVNSIVHKIETNRNAARQAYAKSAKPVRTRAAKPSLPRGRTLGALHS